MSTGTDVVKPAQEGNGWEPNILAFCCNWCSYAGADLAGVSRFQYPPTVKILRVMCSSRVEPAFILKALREGADGVLIAGCHIGDCHYIDGNKNAQIRINNTKKALVKLGLDKRLRLEWISASEGLRFSEVIKDFTEEIKKLGKNPVNEPQIMAPRVTPLEGVSTHAPQGKRVRGVENPQGFGNDERRLIASANKSAANVQGSE
ncbi:MAG: hydrogenase iron-sulfur subunit [Candidatus Methanoperedens sp.]|nr:hydrogenase iron-sulfur subunit [Candidatus Methanoperedens sp.]